MQQIIWNEINALIKNLLQNVQMRFLSIFLVESILLITAALVELDEPYN